NGYMVSDLKRKRRVGISCLERKTHSMSALVDRFENRDGNDRHRRCIHSEMLDVKGSLESACSGNRHHIGVYSRVHGYLPTSSYNSHKRGWRGLREHKS